MLNTSERPSIVIPTTYTLKTFINEQTCTAYPELRHLRPTQLRMFEETARFLNEMKIFAGYLYQRLPNPTHLMETIKIIEILPPDFQSAFISHLETTEELVIDAGQPFTLRDTEDWEIQTEHDVEQQHIVDILNRLGGLKDDNRVGINGTLHRVSGLPNKGRIEGLTIRIGRHRDGVAEVLRPYIERYKTILVMGAPGTGKTTTIRDIVRIMASIFKTKVVVVDASEEIAGGGTPTHPSTSPARRIGVKNTHELGDLMMQAVANHTPRRIIVDEIAKTDHDVEAVFDIEKRGVGLMASIHGSELNDALINPKAYALFGLDSTGRKRVTRPSFELVIECRAKGRYAVHTSVTDSVDRLLVNEEPDFIKVGNWPLS